MQLPSCFSLSLFISNIYITFLECRNVPLVLCLLLVVGMCIVVCLGHSGSAYLPGNRTGTPSTEALRHGRVMYRL